MKIELAFFSNCVSWSWSCGSSDVQVLFLPPDRQRCWCWRSCSLSDMQKKKEKKVSMFTQRVEGPNVWVAIRLTSWKTHRKSHLVRPLQPLIKTINQEERANVWISFRRPSGVGPSRPQPVPSHCCMSPEAPHTLLASPQSQGRLQPPYLRLKVQSASQ